MNKKFIKINLIILIIFGAIFAGYLAFRKTRPQEQNQNNQNTIKPVEYRNEEFGFSFSLPETWRGYTVSIDKWTGYVINDELGDTPYTDGPVVSIHNPKWTKEVMYQDIPIMVFTLSQWDELKQEKFHIGAAPIGPSELGRNSKYVFALPARYNYSFPPGFEEVEEIIRGNPLKTF